MANKDIALDTLVREELGIDPDELGGSAWTAAGTSFGLFALGAIFPVAPFFLARRHRGAARQPRGERRRARADRRRHLAVHRPLSCAFSGARQLAIGFAAAALTYGIGRLVGVSLGG